MAGPKLGILAGGGDLPARLVESCQRTGREMFVIAFAGQADHPVLETVPHRRLRLGAAGQVIAALRAAGCVEVVMAGRIRRPSLKELRPDLRGTRLFARIGLKALGDDGLLRLVAAELEEEGFRLIAPQDVTRELLAEAGQIAGPAPDAQAMADIAHGRRVAKTLGGFDVGQGCVVQQGLVLALEAIEGTDAMLARAGALRRDGPGGVLVKICKPGQETRADLPAIGPATVTQAARAGLRGIAVEAGGALVIDREKLSAAAEAAGLFVIGMTDDDGRK